jgi:hypothetical protein
MCLLLLVASLFIAAKIVSTKNFYLFVLFWSGLPGLVTGPATLALNAEVSLYGKKRNKQHLFLYTAILIGNLISYSIAGFLIP